MTQKFLQRRILDHCDQVVIYGANGWMGRSALDYISTNSPQFGKESVLLIGSKPSTLRVKNETFEVVDPSTGFFAIRENSIFFNAAFLRREFLQQMPLAQYRDKNEEIADFAKNAIKQKKIISFINLSSGAARDLDRRSEISTVDEYSRIKNLLESAYLEICSEHHTSFVNCRIYNLTGKNLNEFENLALSSFINQVRTQNRIEVKSPATKRTYVDATNLAGTLLSVGSFGEEASFDSGGTLLTMLELAESVAEVLGNDQTEIIMGNDRSPDYFGDYENFNRLATKMGQNLIGMKDQILNTMKAFN